MTPIGLYRRWLIDKVGSSPDPDLTYDILFSVFWELDFEYFVPNDADRAADGRSLRHKFEVESSIPLPDLGECRILEVLVGIAIRMADVLYVDEHSDDVSECFWELIQNLELDTNDDSFEDEITNAGDISAASSVLCNRKYGTDGSGGGLFPLKYPHEDQSKVEIWFQMQAYLSEKWSF